MAFPQTALPLLGELYVNTLGWVDFTSDVRLSSASSGGGISITRGRSAEGSAVDSGSCSFVLNNRQGKYSPRNPLSVYYGLIGRNTPVRFSLPLFKDTFNRTVSGGLGTSSDGYSWSVSGASEWTVSAGKATLALTALNTVRTAILGGGALAVDSEQVADFTPSAAMTGASLVTGFVARYLNGSNFYWLRAEFDPGNVMTLKISKAVNGVQAELGMTRPAPGVTYDANTPIRVRACVAGSQLSIKAWPVGSPEPKEWHLTVGDASLRSPGNGGFRQYIVATNTNNPIPTVSFSNYSVSNPRFQGEISAWPQRWDITEEDSWVPVEAAGIMRRLGQGQKAFSSPIYRALSEYSPTAYLPLEDGSDSTSAASALPGGLAGAVTDVSFASDDSLPGAFTSARLESNTSSLTFYNKPKSSVPSWTFLFYFKFDSTPPSGAPVLLRLKTTGTVTDWALTADNTGFIWTGTDASGATVYNGTGTYGGGVSPTGWIALQLNVIQVGGSVDVNSKWHAVGSGGFFVMDPGGPNYTGTVGNVTSVTVGPNTLPPMSLAHMAVFPQEAEFGTTSFVQGSAGYVGETAGRRALRLGSEQGIPVIVAGDPDVTEPMGKQGADTFLNLLKSCADADGGILHETRAGLGLVYRTRASCYNQTPVEASYSGGHVSTPFEPIEDDSAIRNDVTVTRQGGSSARVAVESGPLSIQSAPDGVGVYEEAVTLNLAADSQASNAAGWRTHLGTVDEARYPRVRFDLASSAWSADPLLTRKAAALDSGDLLAVTDLPSTLPPGPIDLMVQGYTERLDAYDWDITFNATPGTPWTVGEVDSDTRVDSDSSVVASAITSTATSMLVSSKPIDVWTTDATNFPIPILVGGEEMSATAIAPAFADTFTRTVSNGWGGGWTLAAGSASNLDVNGTVGRHTLSAAGSSVQTAVTSVTTADLDITVSQPGISVAPTGNHAELGVRARVVGTSHVDVRFYRRSSGDVNAVVRQVIGGVESAVSSFVTVPGATNTSSLTVRLQAIGTSVQAKVWVTGQPEPSDWLVSTTVTHVAEGEIRLYSGLLSGVSNAPLLTSWDNVTTLSPQIFTVTRSVNGIVKAQSANTPVRVANPAIVAL
ncbi:hypothetical protein ACQPZK_07595 [Micromonospora sp. CA-249363]|uniref:hypothetical protein n=1 Tax=Micromonospora sp. CA-249363 TaxID=3239963 RepID=UPI003D8E9F06